MQIKNGVFTQILLFGAIQPHLISSFSWAALQMVKNKVLEMTADLPKLILSFSCDDKSIRKLYIH